MTSSPLLTEVLGNRIRLAVTFGRFSPIKNGHVNGIKDMLCHANHLTIGVIDSSTKKVMVSPEFDYFSCQADQKNNDEHTLFSVEERFEMVCAALSQSINNGKVSVKIVPRPEYALEQFTNMFPIDDYTVMFSGVMDSCFDCERNRIMSSMLGRRVILINPTDIPVHNSEIQDRIQKGEIRWKDIIPPSAYELFLRYAEGKPLVIVSECD